MHLLGFFCGLICVFATSDKSSRNDNNIDNLPDLFAPKIHNNLNPDNRKELKTKNIDKNDEVIHIIPPRSNGEKYDSKHSELDTVPMQTEPEEEMLKDKAETDATHSSTNSPDHKKDTRLQNL